MYEWHKSSSRYVLLHSNLTDSIMNINQTLNGTKSNNRHTYLFGWKTISVIDRNDAIFKIHMFSTEYLNKTILFINLNSIVLFYEQVDCNCNYLYCFLICKFYGQTHVLCFLVKNNLITHQGSLNIRNKHFRIRIKHPVAAFCWGLRKGPRKIFGVNLFN